MNKDQRLKYLFERLYRQEASETEKDELMDLLRPLSDEELSALTREAWGKAEIGESLFDKSKSQEMLNNILRPAISRGKLRPIRTKLFNWPRAVAAALIIILAGVGYLLFFKSQQKFFKSQSLTIVSDLPPGHEGAVLTLGDGKKIVLDSLQNRLLA